MVRFNDLFGNRCCQGTYLTPSKAICTLYLSTVYFARWVILHTPNCQSDLVCWQAAHAKPNGPWGGYIDHIAQGPTKMWVIFGIHRISTLNSVDVHWKTRRLQNHMLLEPEADPRERIKTKALNTTDTQADSKTSAHNQSVP